MGTNLSEEYGTTTNTTSTSRCGVCAITNSMWRRELYCVCVDRGNDSFA